jgi:hypothetical protein
MKNFEKSLLSTIFSMLCALLLQKHIQSYIPNNYQVINKNKMSHNTLCPCKIAKGRQSLCPIGERWLIISIFQNSSCANLWTSNNNMGVNFPNEHVQLSDLIIIHQLYIWYEGELSACGVYTHV